MGYAKRGVLVALGWLVATVALYAVLAGLELDWNLYDWQPKADWKAAGLILGLLVLLVTFRFLAMGVRNGLSYTVSLIAGLALLIWGIYNLTPEPLSHGLFSREASSPRWYRGGRLIVMALPIGFWGFELFRRR